MKTVTVDHAILLRENLVKEYGYFNNKCIYPNIYCCIIYNNHTVDATEVLIHRALTEERKCSTMGYSSAIQRLYAAICSKMKGVQENYAV